MLGGHGKTKSYRDLKAAVVRVVRVVVVVFYFENSVKDRLSTTRSISSFSSHTHLWGVGGLPLAVDPLFHAEGNGVCLKKKQKTSVKTLALEVFNRLGVGVRQE